MRSSSWEGYPQPGSVWIKQLEVFQCFWTLLGNFKYGQVPSTRAMDRTTNMSFHVADGPGPGVNRNSPLQIDLLISQSSRKASTSSDFPPWYNRRDPSPGVAKIRRNWHPFPRKTQHLRQNQVDRVEAPSFQGSPARMRQSGPSLIQCDDVSTSASHEQGKFHRRPSMPEAPGPPCRNTRGGPRIMCVLLSRTKAEFDGVLWGLLRFQANGSPTQHNTMLFAPGPNSRS